MRSRDIIKGIKARELHLFLVIKGFQNKMPADVTYTDFSKAFNSDNFQLLLLSLILLDFLTNFSCGSLIIYIQEPKKLSLKLPSLNHFLLPLEYLSVAILVPDYLTCFLTINSRVLM